MTATLRKYAALLTLATLAAAARADDIKILTNHLGYEPDAPKHAILLAHDGDDVTSFRVLTYLANTEVFTGHPEKIGPCDQWKNCIFWTADLSPLHTEGTYTLEATTNHGGGGTSHSFPVLIQSDLLERPTLSNVIYYFKGQRSSGLLDKADHNLKFQDSDTTADVHGGWYDATGDYGKHLSHLSFSTFFNPQQIPMTDWSLFKTYEELKRRNDQNFRQYKRRLLDEAMYGADYLVRVKNPDGSFYRSVSASGGEKAPQDRRIATEGEGFAIKTLATKDRSPLEDLKKMQSQFPYEVGYRNGGGIAIAALAVASTYDVSGEFPNTRYLQTAEDAFAYLEKNNTQLCNDGKENIVDDYCALMAATELFRATKNEKYKSAADKRAENLMARLTTKGDWKNYRRADDTDRPFFHAADAGFPVVSLLNYSDIATDAQRTAVVATVRASMQFELATTSEVPNPFGYARQLVQSKDGSRRTAFFFPHDTETAPWWQGENASLASLAAAARLAYKLFTADKPFHDALQAYAWNQLNWILGENPFDTCMLQSTGRNNIPYMFFTFYEYTNAPGGIINGITGGLANPHDIDFDLGFRVTGKDEDWRWGEQWLPHAAWYLYAASLRD